MENQILHADVLDAQLFTEAFVDLTITSPPYNVDIPYASNDDSLSYDIYLDFTEHWLSKVYSWTQPTGRLCLNIPLDKNRGGQQSVGADITTIAKRVGWKYHSTVIWNEQNISRRTAWGSWLSASAPYVIAPVELILILYKDSWKRARRGTSDIDREEFIAWTNGVWNFPGESKKRIGHPAPFPQALPRRCIKLFSYVDDLIFDPFLGSGTTAIVAKQLGRRYVGVEIDAGYHRLALKSISQQGLL